jgi:hypothetical protein
MTLVSSLDESNNSRELTRTGPKQQSRITKGGRRADSNVNLGLELLGSWDLCCILCSLRTGIGVEVQFSAEVVAGWFC